MTGKPGPGITGKFPGTLKAFLGEEMVTRMKEGADAWEKTGEPAPRHIPKRPRSHETPESPGSTGTPEAEKPTL